MIKENFEYIKKITEAHSPPGREDEVRNLIVEQLKDVAEEILYDNLGSIICRLSKNYHAPKVALVAHMDEVGFLIKSITKEGYLKLYPLGGIDPHIALGSVVTVMNRFSEKIEGIIFTDKNLKDLTFDDLLLDIGCGNQSEVVEMKVRMGDSVTFQRETKFLNKKNIVSKAWDDRVGCILGIEIMKKLKNSKIKNDIYFVGTVQEEIGTRGGKTALAKLNPDVAIILDVATAKDTPGVKEKSRNYGKGPCFVIADKLALGNRVLLNYFTDLCEEEKIPYQLDFLSGGGTDNGPATATKYGVPGISIIIPVRNCHTPNTLLNIEDFENTLKILLKAIEKLDEKVMKSIFEFKDWRKNEFK